jgi:signal transduction histidine kinase
MNFSQCWAILEAGGRHMDSVSAKSQQLNVLKHIIEDYPGAIHVLDPLGITRAVSNQFLRTFDLSREDILDVEEQSLLKTKFFKENKLQELFDKTLQGESNSSQLVEITDTAASSDSRLLFKILFFPIRLTEGTFAGLLYNNVSESATLQRELLAKNAELESFVYTVSHDLKSPLSVIDGTVQILKEDLRDDHNQMKKLAMIERSTSRISTLATSLLSLSRAAKDIEDTTDLIDTRLIIRSVVSEIRDANPEADFDISIGDIPLIKANSETVQQLFQNLLSNSYKYKHPKRKLSITIDVKKGKRRTRISVSDNGIGISQEDVPRIFDVFYRARNASKFHEVEGTGVGLAIVKKIVDSLNGKVWVKSEEDLGTTITMSLPPSAFA